MTPTSLVEAVAPRTGKINKNNPVFLKEEKICYKIVYGILHFAFKFSQSSEIVFQSWNIHRRTTDFSERGLALKGL